MKEIDIEQAASLIPTGHENGKTLAQMMILFSNMGWLDDLRDPERRTRDIISRVAIDYTVCNLQDGHGYFRPTKDDLAAFRKWIAQEESRSKRIYRRLNQAKKVFEDYMKERCNEQRLD